MQAEAGQMNRLFEDADTTPNVETQLVSASELASILGVTKARISQMDKAGIIQREKKIERFLYYGLTKSVHSYCRYLKGQSGSQSEREKLEVARRRKLEVETEKLEIEKARIQGHLIDAGEMRSANINDGMNIRQNLLSVVGRIAEKLALDSGQMQQVDSIVKKALEIEGDRSPDN